MTKYAITPPEATVLTIDGSDLVFPVRRVYCIGRNYAAHAREMGHDPDREPPFFFQKNSDNVNTSGVFAYPPLTSEVHFEVELVVALASGGSDIAENAAMDCVFGYGIGLDMTRRDLQGEAKKLGRPWEVGKAFEGSAPMGALRERAKLGDMQSGSIRLLQNGEMRQQGDLSHMIWRIPEMIAILSRYFVLAAGDLIMTGTPSGVGACAIGDVLEARIEGLDALVVKVVEE